MALTRAERESFLAEPHVGALAVDAQDGRAPLTVPIWYQYAPGGELWVLTGVDSRKTRLIQAAGRFSLLADRVQPTVRYVSVEGPVVRVVPGTVDLLREMVARYLPPDRVEDYVRFSLANHGEQIAVHMRPERWLSAELGG